MMIMVYGEGVGKTEKRGVETGEPPSIDSAHEGWGGGYTPRGLIPTPHEIKP